MMFFECPQCGTESMTETGSAYSCMYCGLIVDHPLTRGSE